MPNIWLLGGDTKEEEEEEDSEVEEEGVEKTVAKDNESTASVKDLDHAIDVFAGHLSELMDPVAVQNLLKVVQNHLNENSQAKPEATDEPQEEEKGVAEGQEEKDEGLAPNTLSLVAPPAASDVAVDLGDIELGNSNKGQVEKEGDSAEVPAAKSTTNQKGVNGEWLKWLETLEGVKAKTNYGLGTSVEETKAREQEDEQMAEEAIEAISAAVVEAVKPAVVEQEVSYDQFGTMVSCLINKKC